MVGKMFFFLNLLQNTSHINDHNWNIYLLGYTEQNSWYCTVKWIFIPLEWFVCYNKHERRMRTHAMREIATVPTSECLRDTEEFGVTLSVVVEIAPNILVSLGDTDDLNWRTWSLTVVELDCSKVVLWTVLCDVVLDLLDAAGERRELTCVAVGDGKSCTGEGVGELWASREMNTHD